MQDTARRGTQAPRHAGNLTRSRIPDNAPGFDRDTMTRKVAIPIGPQTPEDEKAGRIAYLVEERPVTENPSEGIERGIDWWDENTRGWVRYGRKPEKEDPDIIASTRAAQEVFYPDDEPKPQPPKYVGTPGSKLQAEAEVQTEDSGFPKRKHTVNEIPREDAESEEKEQS